MNIGKLFKKEEKRVKEFTWDDVSLSQYIQLSKLDYKDENSLYDIIAILFGEDVLKQPINVFVEKVRDYSECIKFISTDIDMKLPKKVYEVNGKKYVLDLKTLTTAQYIDYTSLMKMEKDDSSLAKAVSIFLIPEGKEYGSYDIEEVEKDVMDMPITDVMSISVFFSAALLIFIKHFRYYSEKRIMRLKLPRVEKKRMIEEMNKIINSEYFRY